MNGSYYENGQLHTKGTRTEIEDEWVSYWTDGKLLEKEPTRTERRLATNPLQTFLPHHPVIKHRKELYSTTHLWRRQR